MSNQVHKITDENFNLMMEVIQSAIDVVDERRHGRYRDAKRALKALDDAVDLFITETYNGDTQ